jgi:uncharacterized protein YggE
MDARARFALAVLAAHLAVGPAPALATEPARRTLRVLGEGYAAAAPDVAVAALGVEALAAALSAATADANERMRRVLDALSASGVARKDVQTSRYDVAVERRPEPRGGPAGVSGYHVTNEVRVTIRDLARVGRVLDAAVKAGANASRGLAFRKEDPSAERNRALSAAIAAARTKAEVLARAAGRGLGEVLEISEGGGPRPVAVQGFRAMAAVSDSVPVEAGELQFSAQVEVVFALE